MAAQGYGTAPGRVSANAVGTSLPRSVTTKAVPIIKTAMASMPSMPKTKGVKK